MMTTTTPKAAPIVGNSLDNVLFGTVGNDEIFGLAGKDFLNGQDGNDLLDGGRGNDSLLGGNGNDQLLGGSDTDVLLGEAGDDLIRGGDDNDFLDGGRGNDLLFGEAGDDLLRGAGGDDFLEGGSGNDLLLGKAGDDFLRGGAGRDRLEGGNGNDALRGRNGDDLLLGGAGNDVLDGDNGDDVLDGGDGVDAMRGGHGKDTLNGGNGNDALLGEAGDDTISGGAGDDIIEGDATLTLLGLIGQNKLISFDPSDPSKILQTIQVSGVDGNLIGIDVRPADNRLYGITDTSKIYTIDFKTGVANLVSTLDLPFNGGQFSGVDFNPVPDRLRLVGANDQNFRVNVDIGAVADFDPVAPGTQPDGTLMYAAGDPNFGKDPTITAIAYTNSFFPSPAAGRLTTLYGIDTDLDILVRQGGLDGAAPSPNDGQLFTVGSLGVDFDANTGFDIFAGPNGINVATAVSNSTLYIIDLNTGAARNVGQIGDGSFDLFGFVQALDRTATGNDIIAGGGGNDVIGGGNGDDTIAGGTGNDTLTGHAGNDVLTGGNGNDSFFFGSNTAFNPADFGVDRITDFTVGEDKIVLDQTTFGMITAANIAIVADDVTARISTGLITYSTSSGNLFFNQNGVEAGLGTGARIAALEGKPILDVSDFAIVP